MKKIFQRSINNNRLSVKKDVEYSLKRYRKTYELLEEYDKNAVRDPETLADAGRLRPYIRDLKEKSGLRRANSSI